MIDVSNIPQVLLTEGAKKINLYFNYPCSNFILRGLPIFFWDKCVFYKGRVIYVLYTDDSIIAAPAQKEIDNEIATYT